MSERDLWVAVIYQALKDATATPHEGLAATNTKPSFHEARAARDWFVNGGRDFMRACCNAELDPHFVRDGALRQISMRYPQCAPEKGGGSGINGAKRSPMFSADRATRDTMVA